MQKLSEEKLAQFVEQKNAEMATVGAELQAARARLANALGKLGVNLADMQIAFGVSGAVVSGGAEAKNELQQPDPAVAG